ncbi:MAG: 50S ribosomal protein L24 [Bacteroidota bacterium]
MNRKFNKQPKLKIRKGDRVQVIAGDDKQKEGRVLEVFPEKNRAIVEGINMVTKHQKTLCRQARRWHQETEAAINISNLVLIDPSSGKPTRVGRKANDKGVLQRYAKKSGSFLTESK